MKNRIILFAAVLLSLTFAENAIGQPPLPPAGHGSTSNSPPGAGAPVGSGIIILITLSAAYGAKKMYTARQGKIDN